MGKYESLFSDEEAAVSSSGALHQRHGMLRAQIAKPLVPFCEGQQRADAAYLAEFIAESLLAWSGSSRSFEEISSILLQLF